MRQKTEQIILTFNTTIDAISCEKYCSENGIEGRIIPVPRMLSASCGMAFKAPLEADSRISDAIEKEEIRTAGKYRLYV